MIDKPFVEFDSDAVRLVTEKRDIFMNYSFYYHFFEHFSKAKALSLMENCNLFLNCNLFTHGALRSS